MKECRRTTEIGPERALPDRSHLDECRDCREAALAQGLLTRLAKVDEISPSLPDPAILLLKAELVRRQMLVRDEGSGARSIGVAIWSAIAITWLVVLTSNLEKIQALFEKSEILAALPGGALTTVLLVAAVGGLMAFTIFAVAVHSVLAEF